MYDLRARYYNLGNGKFNSRDTYPVNFNNPIELNRYGYTADNPTNASDPSGDTLLESSMGYENSRKELEKKRRQVDESKEESGSAGVGEAILRIYAATFSKATAIFLKELILDQVVVKVKSGPNMGKTKRIGSNYTFAVGVVWDAKNNNLHVGVSVNNFEWNKLNSDIRRSFPGIDADVVFAIKLIMPYADVITDNFPAIYRGGKHAEEVVARWGIKKFYNKETYHPMLAIGASREPCGFERSGFSACKYLFGPGGFYPTFYKKMFRNTIVS